jgi:hypothetical protein
VSSTVLSSPVHLVDESPVQRLGLLVALLAAQHLPVLVHRRDCLPVPVPEYAAKLADDDGLKLVDRCIVVLFPIDG